MFTRDFRWLRRGVAGTVFVEITPMEIKEKAQLAIHKIEAQLNELTQLQQKGHVDEVADRVDRWYDRTKKVIDDFVSNTEAMKFEAFSPWHSLYGKKNETLFKKIEYYERKLRVIIQELETHPDSLIDPSKLIVSAEDVSQFQFVFTLLHSEIVRVSKQKFLDKHYSDSVESAFKEVNHRIKLFLRLKHGDEKDGVPLMRDVFGGQNPKILLGDLATETGKNMQEGYCHIFAGSIQAIRNPKAHENILIDKSRAIHFLFLASLEMQKLDEANIPQVGDAN